MIHTSDPSIVENENTLKGIQLTWSYADLSEDLKNEIEQYFKSRQIMEAERRERQRSIIKRQTIEEAVRELSGGDFEDDEDDGDFVDEEDNGEAGSISPLISPLISPRLIMLSLQLRFTDCGS